MAVPVGADLTRFQDNPRRLEYRAVVGIKQAWLALVTDTFGAALDESKWWHTEPSPLVSGGNLHIRRYGSDPPWEVAITTPKWFPITDLTVGFEIEINATFPQTNPGYTTQIAVLTLDGGRGKPADSVRILQIGEDYPISSAGGSIGDIRVEGPLGVNYVFDGTQTSHEYIIQWDPDGGTDSLGELTIKVDGTNRAGTPSDNDDFTEPGGNVDGPWIVRPYSIVVGTIAMWDEDVVTDVGSPTTPADLITVHDIEVRQLGVEGYETQVDPGWTFANAGGTLDTADIGERFTLDGEEMAKLPNVIDFDVDQGRPFSWDQFTLQLATSSPTVPRTTQNIFQGDHWHGRPIQIDARIADSTGAAFTPWVRLMSGTIETVLTRQGDNGLGLLTISGRDRASAKIDNDLTRSYTDAIAATESVIVQVALTMDEVLEDIIAMADASWDADELGDTDFLVEGPPEMKPQDLNTGPNLLAGLNSICDEIGLEHFRRYTVSGSGRYGLIVIAKWTVGGELDTSATKFTINGTGAAGVNNVRSIELLEDSLAGVGMIVTHADSMTQVQSFLSGGEGGPGDFPRAPYPPRARELHRSLTASGVMVGLPLFKYPDQDADNHLGGSGKHAWLRENGNRRRAVVELVNHTWPQPTDEAVIDDPEITGLTTAESWVVDSIHFKYADGFLLTTLELVSQDVVGAVRSQV